MSDLGFSMIAAEVLDSDEWWSVRSGARDVYTSISRCAKGGIKSDRYA